MGALSRAVERYRWRVDARGAGNARKHGADDLFGDVVAGFGYGVLNDKRTGCIARTHDCPGGIIGNNQFPLIDPVPVLRPDWQRLPAPGTRVVVVLSPVPSGRE